MLEYFPVLSADHDEIMSSSTFPAGTNRPEPLRSIMEELQHPYFSILPLCIQCVLHIFLPLIPFHFSNIN